MKSFKLGIYGGTFAPIHNGHINAAHKFYDELSLDKLLIIPTFIPPHKSPVLGDDPEARLEMTAIAFEGDGRNIEVSDYEIRKGGKSYTYLTLRHFFEPNTEIYFLCGTDMFLTFPEWKNPKEIFSLCKVALIRREKISLETEEKLRKAKEKYISEYSADIVEIITEPIEISSSEIRDKISLSEDVSGLVPPRVYEYIIKNRLYRDCSDGGSL